MRTVINKMFRSFIALFLVFSMVLSTGGNVFAASKESATTNNDSEITKELQELYQVLKESGVTDTESTEEHSYVSKMKTMIPEWETKIRDYIDHFDENDGTMTELKEMVNGILNDIKSIDEEKLDKPVEKARIRLHSVMDEVEAKSKEGNNNLEEILLDKMKEVAQILRDDATTGVYTMTENPYCVSLGDSSVTGFGLDIYEDDAKSDGYKEKLEGTFSYEYARSLGLDTDTQYEQLGISGLRAEDMLYILDETYVPDEYGEDLFAAKTGTGFASVLKKKGLDSLRAAYKEEIEKADLITVGFGFNEITTYVIAQIYGSLINNGEQPYAFEWQKYVDEETETKIQEILTDLEGKFRENGMDTINVLGQPIDVAKTMDMIVESYAYGYVSFLMNYTKVLGIIHEWNPDAQVALVGMYNPMKGLSLNMDMDGEESIMPVGDYVEYLIQLTNMFYTSYALLIPNTTLVEIPDVTLDTDNSKPVSIVDVIFDILMYNNCEALQANADADGHVYIKNQIEEAISIHRHSYETKWTSDDTTHWHSCTCEIKKDEANHSYTDEKDTTCNVCGRVRVVKEEKPSTPSNPPQEGNTTVTEPIAVPKTVTLSKTSYTFNGKEFKPTVTVKDEKNAVIDPAYYSVSYKNNKNAGKATVTVTFRDKYAAMPKIETSFVIKKASYKSVKIKDAVYTGKRIKKVTLLTSSGTKLAVSDYTVKSKTFKNNTKIGTASVVIKFKGKNIKSATKRLTFKIVPKSTKITKLAKGKKQIKVYFKKTKNISGYQIQYSTSKKFTSKTTKTVKNIKAGKSSYTIKKLKAKKTYYVRIRTYKKAGKTYYSSWSTVKSMKTR